MKALKSIEEKLCSAYEVVNECWEVVKYKGYRSGGHRHSDGIGYPRIPHMGAKLFAHRVAYQAWVGPIPEGYHVDHTCRNRQCINPLHLEAVPPDLNYSRRKW